MSSLDIAALKASVLAEFTKDGETIMQRLEHIIDSSYNRTDDAGGGGLSLGETNITAYRGDRGKTAYDHSQAAHETPGAAAAAESAANAYTDEEIAILSDALTILLAGKAPSLGADDNYVTDADKIVIGNTSGTNSGDNAVNTLYSGLAASKQDADSDLTAIAAITPSNDDIIQRKAGAWTNRTPAQVKTDLVLVKGDVGLGNLDNTSDANKPVSTAQQTALDLKQNTSGKDATGGYAGLTLFKINFKNALNTFTSFLTNANTAARTYTFPDRDGTIADDTDITAAKARASHTGTQLASTVSDFNTAALLAAPAETGVTIRTALGTTTIGAAINVLVNPSAITFLKVNADNTVTARSAANFLSDIGAQAAGTYLTSANIVDAVTDAVTDKAPSQNAVFDALALKAPLISPSLTTPAIGVATGTSLVVSGALTSSGGGNGYSTGAGGTQSQGTSRTTTVVLSKLCGNITMFSAAQAAQAIVTFTLTNTFIAATDFILIQHISATNAGAWQFSVVAGSGTCNISIRNVSTASITEATPLRFTIIKGVTS